jgi:hypothetical protein
MCDNTCAIGIATDSIKQKRAKAIDMRFHWIRDGVPRTIHRTSYISNPPIMLLTISPKTQIQLSTNSSCNSWPQATQNCSRGCVKVIISIISITGTAVFHDFDNRYTTRQCNNERAPVHLIKKHSNGGYQYYFRQQKI